ncbi:uncharacterized protein LOC135394594 [Ornithodoros turicata]|uniref:uncharacterized protein LOC135394594 n=1 Tax=Ornithodoros turicata TaxID=34597 RepID=UPI00313A3505
MTCSVPGCVNKGSKAKIQKCRWHRIPKNEPARSTWLKLINRQDIPPGIAVTVCHLHFTPDDYVTNIRLAHSLGVRYQAYLRRDATPSLYLPGTSQPNKPCKTEDPQAANPKPTGTQPYSKQVSQTVSAGAAKCGAPSALAAHSTQAASWSSGTQVCPMKADASTQTVSTEFRSKGSQVNFQVKSMRSIHVQVENLEPSHRGSSTKGPRGPGRPRSAAKRRYRRRSSQSAQVRAQNTAKRPSTVRCLARH